MTLSSLKIISKFVAIFSVILIGLSEVNAQNRENYLHNIHLIQNQSYHTQFRGARNLVKVHELIYEVFPGGNPSDIPISQGPVYNVKRLNDGSLEVQGANDKIQYIQPVAYQINSWGIAQAVPARIQLVNNRLILTVAKYEMALPLRIQLKSVYYPEVHM